MDSLDWQELMREAERTTALSTWGDRGFVDGLKTLTRAIAADRRLPDQAREGARAQVAALLARRLRLYRDRESHPEIPAQAIHAPLVVVGMPRSGTTLLHALLAQDPRARAPLTWEVEQPSPPPRTESFASDPRIAASQAQIDHVPDAFKRMHMVGAELPLECNSIVTLAFQSSNFSALFDIPAYMDWYLTADDAAAYATHLHTLQHLQAFAPRDHWVLKSPGHMFHMPRLLVTYPDARIVFPHRDPVATLPSQASLIAYMRRQAYGTVDQCKLGREMADYWHEALRRAVAFRRDPRVADRFVDVHYDALVRDPIAVVRAIYERFGMDFTPAAEQAMRAFLAAQPKDKHGSHRYTLEDYGLSKTAIRADYADYLDEYGVERA